MSLRDKLKSYDKQYGTGNFYKFVEGQNQLRILAEPEWYHDLMDGQQKGTFITYALFRDPEEGDVPVLVNLPMVVVRWLADEVDLGKFTDYPMPYDILILKTGKGIKSRYMPVAVDITMSPQLTVVQQEAVGKLKPLREIADLLSKKKMESKQIEAPAHPAPMPQIQAARNSAEVNHMFQALSNALNSAKNSQDVMKIMSMIDVGLQNGSIGQFEVDLLTPVLEAKKQEFGLVPDPSHDIVTAETDTKVDDIPF